MNIFTNTMIKLVVICFFCMNSISSADQKSPRLEYSYPLKNSGKYIWFTLYTQKEFAQNVSIVLKKLGDSPREVGSTVSKPLMGKKGLEFGVTLELWPKEDFLKGWKSLFDISEYGTYKITFSTERNNKDKSVMLSSCTFEITERAGSKLVKIKSIGGGGGEGSKEGQ